MKSRIFLSCLALVLGNALNGQTDVTNKSPFAPDIHRMFDEQYAAKEEKPVDRENRKALEAIGKQEWKTAFNHLMSAMKEDPDDVNTYINFGIFHFARKEYPSSEKALLKALEVDPENAKTNYHYSRVMTLKGEKDLALQAAKKAAEREEPEWMHLNWLSDLYERDNQFQDASGCLTQALIILRGKLELVNDSIQKVESQEEVVETYEDIEVISDSNGVREEVVQKFNTAYKEAPEEWHKMKATYEAQIAELEARQKELLEKAASSS